MASILSNARGVSTLGRHVSRYATHASNAVLSSLPISVRVSPKEVSSRSLSWQNLELAVRALHRDGLVVLEDVIDHSKLDFLNVKMVEDARILQSMGDASPFNYNRGSVPAHSPQWP